VLCSSQDHFETETRDLDHYVLAGAENTDKRKIRFIMELKISVHGTMNSDTTHL
jgi:hypothetical protein